MALLTDRLLPFLLLLLPLLLPLVHADSISFGTGLSSNQLYPHELDLFTHSVSPSSTVASLTHFWIAGAAPLPDIDSALIRYYIDGESSASIQFTPSLLCGVGFNDGSGPWGGRWMGKGAVNGGWWNQFRVPFQKSIRVTGQLTTNTSSTLVWTIIRGNEDLPTTIGGFTLPASARLVQSRILTRLFQPLEWVTLVNLPNATGLHFAHVLQAASANLNFLEGCYHGYTPYDVAFPGLLLSTGTEDFFSSADYFDGGLFHFDHAGLTHFTMNSSLVRLSAYRLHELDPVQRRLSAGVASRRCGGRPGLQMYCRAWRLCGGQSAGDGGHQLRVDLCVAGQEGEQGSGGVIQDGAAALAASPALSWCESFH